jgi:hypothetical protein
VANAFTLPTSEQFETACEFLKLSDNQARELARIIHTVRAELRPILHPTMSKEDRQSLRSKLGKFDASLIELLAEIGVTAQYVATFKESDYNILDVVTVSAGARLVGSIKGRRRMPKSVPGDGQPNLAFRTLGFVPELIKLKKELNFLLDAGVTDPGGRDPDFVRHLLVAKLIKAANDILGVAATGTENGPFMVLAEVVTGICGLPEKGLAKIVERNLSAMKATT